ncbi:MAG: nucleotidyltransferase domain-containing protein [Asgard group archaeon]|nr:nucleotidyltransferase domain-containing protein [Asgard group archaeon]
MEDPHVRQQYDAALASFVERAKKDKKVLALILYGSLAYDEIHEGSNINVYVITAEGQHRWTRLIENGIPIDIAIYNENEFKRRVQGRSASIYYHQFLAYSKLVFSRDETFTKFYNNIDRKLGTQDKGAIQILYHFATLYDLEKAEKFLFIKKDLVHSFYYLMHAISEFGYFICYKNSTYPPREVLLKINEFEPELYQATYLNLLQNQITHELLETTIKRIYDYMAKTDLETFKPVLDFISNNEGIATQTELNDYFSPKGIRAVDMKYLQRRRIVRHTVSPVHLTKKGLVEYNEGLFHFDYATFDPEQIVPIHIGPYNVDRSIVQRDYQKALDDLVSKAKKDDYVLSFILGGSLSYDTVWEKSDIDALIVTNDEVHRNFRLLLENDVYYDCNIFTRDQVRKWSQRVKDGSLSHSWFYKSTLVFTRDESIKDLYEDVQNVGSADIEDYVFLNYQFSRDLLKKAEKALYVKEDPFFSFYFVMAAIRRLAIMEVVLNKTIPMREVILQAIEFNPEFFDGVYKRLALSPNKNKETVEGAIQEISKYLDERIEIIARPLIRFLNKNHEETHYTLKTKFSDIQLPINLTDFVKKGLIIQSAAPFRFTNYSSEEMMQPAYISPYQNVDDIMMDFN